MSIEIPRRAGNRIAWLFWAFVMLFLFDEIRTRFAYEQVGQAARKSLQDRDSPRRFNIIATDGVHAEFNDKKYASFSQLQSLDGASAESVAVLLRMPASSSAHAIAMAHSHFSHLGVVNFYFEHDWKKYHRVLFDNSRKNDGAAWDNELLIVGDKVFISGHLYRLEDESADDLRKECESNDAPVHIFCGGETKCEYLRKTIDILNLAPHRGLCLHISDECHSQGDDTHHFNVD